MVGVFIEMPLVQIVRADIETRIQRPLSFLRIVGMFSDGIENKKLLMSLTILMCL